MAMLEKLLPINSDLIVILTDNWIRMAMNDRARHDLTIACQTIKCP